VIGIGVIGLFVVIASIFGIAVYERTEQNLLFLQKSGFSPWLTFPDETILKHFVSGQYLALALPPDPNVAARGIYTSPRLSGGQFFHRIRNYAFPRKTWCFYNRCQKQLGL
jgi:hypothetical protein